MNDCVSGQVLLTVLVTIVIVVLEWTLAYQKASGLENC